MMRSEFRLSEETNERFRRLEELNDRGELFDGELPELRHGEAVQEAVGAYHGSVAGDLMGYNGHGGNEGPVQVEGRVTVQSDENGGQTALWTTCYQHPHNPCIYDCIEQTDEATGKPVGRFKAKNCFTIEPHPDF